jgi:hypothetical protein
VTQATTVLVRFRSERNYGNLTVRE